MAAVGLEATKLKNAASQVYNHFKRSSSPESSNLKDATSRRRGEARYWDSGCRPGSRV